MTAPDEPVLSLEEALAPHLKAAAELKAARERALEVALADLITADDPAPGVAAFGRRMLGYWVEEIDRSTSRVSARMHWAGPVRVAIAAHDRALGGGRP